MIPVGLLNRHTNPNTIGLFLSPRFRDLCGASRMSAASNIATLKWYPVVLRRLKS
jgi:hypothetical protein